MSSYERIMMAPTCRFINAPSLVSPDLSFNEISILVFWRPVKHQIAYIWESLGFFFPLLINGHRKMKGHGSPLLFSLSWMSSLSSLFTGNERWVQRCDPINGDSNLLSSRHSTVVCLQSFLVDILLPGWVLSVMKFIYFTIYNFSIGIFLKSYGYLSFLSFTICILFHSRLLETSDSLDFSFY